METGVVVGLVWVFRNCGSLGFFLCWGFGIVLSIFP